MARHLTFIVLAAVALASAGSSGGLGHAQGGGRLESLPEVPPHLALISMDIAERMLEVAGVTKDDVLYDLGCGDGRVAILAARKYGARAVGVDNDAVRIEAARANAERAGVARLVRFVHQETIDLSEATVVTMTTPQSAVWLGLNGLLHPVLTAQLKTGSRIVTNFIAGSMKDWKPDRIDRFTDAGGRPRAILYLWTTR